MRSSQHEAAPGEVDHHTPSAHWCADCWHWVVDCDHLVNPLPIEHRAVDDAWIRSLAYDRVHGRLEVEFKWDDVLQFCPVSLALFRDLWKSRPMRDALDRIMRDRHIQSRYVRSERKVLRALVRCWGIVAISSDHIKMNGKNTLVIE